MGKLTSKTFRVESLGSILLVALAIPAFAQIALGQASSPPLSQAMQQGTAAMKAGDFAAAAGYFTRVTQLQPGFAEGFFNLGLAEERQGQLDQARVALEKSLHLKPTLRGANLFLGTIAYRENRFKEADASLVRETQLDPQNAKAFMWLGVCRLAEDKPEDAIAPLDRAHKLDPSDVDTLYHRGRAYLLVANQSYASMFKLNPDSVRVHEVLAEAAASAYRNDEALTQYQILVKMAPNQTGLHEGLGDEYWVAGELDKAAEAYGSELQIDPRNTVARFKLGALRVISGKDAEGVQLLTQVVHEDPTLLDAHYYLGNGLSDLDRDEEALGEYEQAIGDGSDSDRASSSYYRLSQVYRKLHRTQELAKAIENFRDLKAKSKARTDARMEQITRTRSQLPVPNPDKTPEIVDN